MKPATDYSFEFLASMRLRGDVAADSLISEVFADDVQKTAFRNLLDFINVNTDLQQVTNFYAVKEAFRSAKKLPSWADQETDGSRRKVFCRPRRWPS